MAKPCTHLNEVHHVIPSAQGCEDCLKIGDTWVHLRLCLSCGHVGCCDSSKKQARHQALSHLAPSHYSIIRAGRALEMVLSR